MSVLKTSWSSFDREIADVYLNGYGHPSPRSKELVALLMREMFGEGSFSLSDFGCGNGHIAHFLREKGLRCRYTGYDFSTVLLDSARRQYGDHADTHFVEADIQDPDMPGGACDIVLFSHTLEMLQSPERSLLAAKRLAPVVMIRFFSLPENLHDVADLCMMNVGGDASVPYIRRSMSKGYYNYLLSATGCRRVDVHQVAGDRDAVHVLTYR